jgi:hypothetical protein
MDDEEQAAIVGKCREELDSLFLHPIRKLNLRGVFSWRASERDSNLRVHPRDVSG